MTDIEIAKNTKLDEINKIAEKLEIKEEDIEQYGKYKAKISNEIYEKNKSKNNGKLILVTAISPTPLGEGKTTVSIAIADGLRKIGKKSILTLREPSLGPVFGIKGGATGGGKVQIAPMEDINLHFTGDIHAITSANNLLSAMIDNHIYFGNELGFEKVVWKRCLDLNDRQLRKVETGLSGESKIVPRIDNFDITVASEIMAVLCLAENLKDLKQKLGNIIIGYNKKEEPIYVKQLKAEGAMTVLLKDAIKPNLVQTLEHTPALVHGGPFANIAHGCNSVIATKTALKLADYTITEAGFGADLGAEKFLDIKCRKTGLKPDAVVIVATIKAIKYHGGVEKEKIQEENIEGIEKGIDNLYKHIDNIKNKFGLNVIVALNKYASDTEKEIEYIKEKLANKNIELSVVEGWAKGGDGAIDIANKLVKLSQQPNEFKYIYNDSDSIKEKILKIAKNIYYAKDVKYSEEAEKQIENIEKMGYAKLPICIAKTQYSFSDDPKNLECKDDYNINVRGVELKNGAGFVVVLAGKIMTMPGLPKVPAAESIDIDEDGEIVGIF
ncbi:MAG: formate--tetrahydrofolate ligase [Clostridia bacterium]|jgi:formate--tetrahydrofolate ligase|nr:formate--tetrahydrofolate ligase [Clostridia bacterium]CDC06814.1 formate--tetrahydrofolate ligase [Clostridium sp. CAG:343]HCF33746.1 formate--tetrahydrofolate ligase [Clostridiales bacterium]MBP8633984.1 formate--tetrahydrofolate ligase [Clostridia bacterium]MBP9922173.1 formate--tetrahydrofolate ligase [Clostridia bacterium]